ncbi:hypothetical protein BH11ARM2_BH11ARM2_05210 [soil metagenome]
MPLSELQETLREIGQAIPVGRTLSEGGGHGRLTVKDALDWNLPHTYEGGFGTWRDWVLGATMETANGLVGKSGARVVKSVAGYDVHRLLIGARGTLGHLREVHLRTVPLATLKEDLLLEGNLPAEEVETILRVPPSELDKTLDSIRYGLVDLDTSTIWTNADPKAPWAKVWRLNGSFVADRHTERFMRRAKSIFDPEGKLPPLELESGAGVSPANRSPRDGSS